MDGYEALIVIKGELEYSGAIFNSRTKEAFEKFQKAIWKDMPMDVRQTYTKDFCPRCNTQISGSPRYCSECGQSIRFRADEEWENRE